MAFFTKLAIFVHYHKLHMEIIPLFVTIIL